MSYSSLDSIVAFDSNTYEHSILETKSQKLTQVFKKATKIKCIKQV